jgi:hypothetical protein
MPSRKKIATSQITITEQVGAQARDDAVADIATRLANYDW